MFGSTDAERLSVALAAASLGDWRWDAATDIVTCSPQAAAIYAIPPEPQLTWARLRERVHADDRARDRRAAKRAVRERGDYTSEYRLAGADERWVSVLGRPCYDDAARLLGMFGVVRDITDNTRTRRTLQEQAETLETIIRVSRLLSAELDPEKLVQALTDAATEVCGAECGAFFYHAKDRGAHALHARSGAARERFAGFPMPRTPALFDPAAGGDPVIRLDDVRGDARFVVAPQDGMPAAALTVRSYLAVPVIGRSGDVIGSLCFGHARPAAFDARAERLVVGLAAQAAIALDNARLYETAQRARQDAEDANRLKDEFLATLSHELRTPLNAVLGWARILRAPAVDAERVAKAAETIERNARAQQEIVEDLLDVSRIVSGRLRLDIGPIALAPIVEAAVDTLRPAAMAKEIRLQVALDADDAVVLGDPNRLQQIVWNLVSNAVKFSPKRSQVQVALRRVDSHLALSVADTGGGIAPEFLPHVFDRFRQSDGGTTRASGGLGLGLAIVRHLVEMLGGTVEAHSDGLGKGATFVVNLPLAALAAPPSAVDGNGSAPAPDDDWRRDALAGLRVLLVDDESDTRELVEEILRECGAEVRAAASAGEAWTLLQRWSPDVIVSDIGMPMEDGYTFIARVRAAGIRTPAAALTAYARSSDRLRALSAGFQAHLAKPAEPDELVALVASLAGRTLH